MRILFFHHLKKLIVVFAMIVAISAVGLKTLYAQPPADLTGTPPAQGSAPAGGGAEGFLRQIAINTSGILQAVNNLPNYMNELLRFIRNWLDPDETTTTANLQQSLSQYSNALAQILATQQTLQPQLNTALLTAGNAGNPSGISATTIPYANDITYSTLLGRPHFDPDPRNPRNGPARVNPALNYIRNASGLGLYHVMPGRNWQGTVDDQTKYFNYYNTVMAVQSFNGYILSDKYADLINGGTFNQLQTTLITQASSSDWFAQVAQEKIGVVLRQILMYESQVFILLTQMLQTQKQMVAATAMTNALLIAANQNNENYLLQKASTGVLRQ